MLEKIKKSIDLLIFDLYNNIVKIGSLENIGGDMMNGTILSDSARKACKNQVDEIDALVANWPAKFEIIRDALTDEVGSVFSTASEYKGGAEACKVIQEIVDDMDSTKDVLKKTIGLTETFLAEQAQKSNGSLFG